MQIRLFIKILGIILIGIGLMAEVFYFYSDRAINVNIQIIRTFVKIRELLATNEALQRKMMDMERKYDTQIKKIFDTLQLLLIDEEIKPKKEIGFKTK